MVNKFSAGVNTSFSTELNENQATSLKASGRNLIRNEGTLSADGGEFSEKYTDVNGSRNSINLANNTAYYDLENGQKYLSGITDEASGDTTHDPDGFVNPANAFDGDRTTLASDSATVGGVSLGKTFAAKQVDAVYVRFSNNSSNQATLLETYNGSTWSSLNSFNGTGSWEGVWVIDSVIQGVRLRSTTSGGGTITIYSIEYGSMAEGEISQTIPTGTFSSTISSAFCTALVADWETGANIQFKLKNAGGDDSGWLNYNAVQTFTAFSAEPDELIVKLIPKSSSPTVGYPSIYGVAVYE